jgi:S-adenosylmethionine hydrolase
VRVIGVNAGYAFSFVRDVAEELRWATVAAEGSQFRSRDLFPQAASAIALGQADALADGMSQEDVPDIPGSVIAYVDGYGNLKTTVAAGTVETPSGSTVRVRIGAVEQEAVLSDGSFAVRPGQLALAPGSSGWRQSSWRSRDGEVRWMELFLRGGNAQELFGHPVVGSQIIIDAE